MRCSSSVSRLSAQQLEELGPFVRDQHILDLGAAHLELSELMLELGARDVLAVDRNPMPRPSSSSITTKVSLFHDLRETRSVVLASWIVNWQVNIEHLLGAAQVVISISKNTDGTACGYEGMWEHLRQRELLLHLPERRNTLTVYGKKLVQRAPTGEEYAALHPHRIWSFEEAEVRARR